MGSDWALLAQADPPHRRSGAPVAGEPRRAQWHPVDQRTGAPWADLPDRSPSYQTCHRRFQDWVRCGVLKDILSMLAEALYDEGYLDLRETFIDGSFAPAKQGGARVGKTKRGKGSKIMAIADRHGLPVAVLVESATPHEVTLVHATLAERFVKELPVRLIGDNAYESDRRLMRTWLAVAWNSSPRTAEREHRGHKTVVRCVATCGGGRSSDCLPGSRTFAGSLSVTTDSPRIFSGCYTSPAASFSCEVYEMASNLI
jgi:Putative transposase of IS4/5 family (DUF4096)/Transposase DDE domain